MNRARWTGVVVALATLQPACALTSKGDPLSMRYFNPQSAAKQSSEPAAQPFELRLGPVSAAANLDERIAYRISASEVGFYEDRRWTEPPEAYLRRALERELFEERKLTRIVTGLSPTLDVELLAFEEQRGNPGKVRVTLRFNLHDERRSLLDRSLSLEQPLPAGGDQASNVAQALADTLDQAVTSVGAEVVQELVKARTTPQPIAPNTD